jgi:hypothetical protein
VWYVEVAIVVPELGNTVLKYSCVSCLIETRWRVDYCLCLLIDIRSNGMTSGKEVWRVVGVVCGNISSST